MFRTIRKDSYGYLFIAPFFLFFILMSLYPILYSLYLSFTNWDGLSPPHLIGFANYVRVLKDHVFYLSIYNTFFIWAISTIPQLIVGLVLAVILHQKFLRGKDLFRAVYFFPNIVTSASIGLLVSFIFDWKTGSMNHLLISMGIIHEPINWLSYPYFARFVVAGVLFWQWFGYHMVIFIAGLQGISPEVLEAAEVDGAGKVKQFFHITLPMLRPVVLFQLVTSMIGAMQIFDVPYTLTDGHGAPENATLSIVIYLYNNAFTTQHYGYAATIAYCLFILIGLFSIVLIRAMNRGQTNDSEGAA